MAKIPDMAIAALTAPKTAEEAPNTVPPVAAPKPAATPKKLAALPPAAEVPRAAPVAPERQITVIRGSRQPASTRSPVPEKPRFASLPTHVRSTATDAPPILVLRGSRSRYALVSAPAPAPVAQPLLVIRGARSRPTILQHYVQPSALILRIRD